jgi:histidinol-phosphatase (PHP family)
MQKFSYHTHTVFSDGADTVDAMLAQAVKLGWAEIGVSDHMIIHKNIKQVPYYEFLKAHNQTNIAYDDFNEALPVFNRHAEEIRTLAQKYPSLKVRVGYEVDCFTYGGWQKEFEIFRKRLDYDYMLTGNHFFLSEDGEYLLDISCYNSLPDNEKPEPMEVYVRRHLQTVKHAVDSGLFNFLAHIDYVRKVKGYNQNLYNDEYDKIIDSLAKNNIATELSTKGLRKSDDFFPCHKLLLKIINKKIPLVISDDAHRCSEVGYMFDKAENTLADLKYNNRFCLK